MILNQVVGGKGDLNVELIGTEQDFRKGLTSVSMGDKTYSLSKGNLCSLEHVVNPGGLINYDDMPIGYSITATQWASHIEEVSDDLCVIAGHYNGNSYSARVAKRNGTTWDLGPWTYIEAMSNSGPQPGPFRIADKEFIISGFRSNKVYWYTVNDGDLSITLVRTFTMPVTPQSQYFKFYTLAMDSSGRVTKFACAGLEYQGSIDYGSKSITFSSGTDLSNIMGFSIWGVEGSEHHFICLTDSGSALCQFRKYTFNYSSGVVTNRGIIQINWGDDQTGGSTNYGSEPLPFAFRVGNKMLLIVSGFLSSSQFYNKYLIYDCDGTASGLQSLSPPTTYNSWITYSGLSNSLVNLNIDPIGNSGDSSFALAPKGPIVSISGSSLVITQLSNNLSPISSYNWDYGMMTRETNPKNIWSGSHLVRVQLIENEVTVLVGYTDGDDYYQVNPYINEPISGYEKYSKLCGVVVDITDTVKVLVPTNM